MNLPQPPKWRTYLILGRVSNLPTVWSNCLAGVWLAGGTTWLSLLDVMAFVSCLYIGGMFLNDAFDANFDRNHRPTRPIPAGLVSEREVWLVGAVWLALGILGLAWMGRTTLLWTLLLAGCILLYNAIHKVVIVAPVVMGACRCLVYLVAASVAVHGVVGEAVWKGIALGGYVMGLSYLARKESARVRIQYSPCILLAAPLVVAWMIDDAANQRAALVGGIVLVVWVVWTLWQTIGVEHPNVGRAVARLLAGIALVDWLAVANFSQYESGLFLVFFWLALLMQYFVPAT